MSKTLQNQTKDLNNAVKVVKSGALRPEKLQKCTMYQNQQLLTQFDMNSKTQKKPPLPKVVDDKM